MDNATKALLIAAAVLVAIILTAYTLKIVGSGKDSADSSSLLGSSLSAKAQKGNRQLVALFDDIYAKNLVSIPDQKINVKNSHYRNFHSALLLEPNTRYVISFDYTINQEDYPIGCGIGYGSNNGSPAYRKDIIYQEPYPNQKDGNFTIVFSTPLVFDSTVGEPYLSLRLARMGSSGNFDVDIENFRFKKAPENLQPQSSIYEKKLTIEVSGSYYIQYYSTLLLEPNTNYTISFDYSIVSASSPVGCGIGYGKARGTRSALSGGSYVRDIAYSITYPNQEKGTFKYTFKSPATFTIEKPYLSLRLARMNSPGSYKINITNLIVQKAK